MGGLVILALLFGLRQFAEMRKDDVEKAETAREETEAPSGGSSTDDLIRYVSHGEAVELASVVPQDGYAIVMFTADW